MNQSIPLSQLESSPGAAFKELGDSYKGRITGIEERQQTDLDGVPLSFTDGTPRMQFVISIEQRDGETVALYAKGGKYKADEGSGESMLAAIGTAVRAAGAASVDVGADLAVAYTGNAKLGGGRVAKLYSAAYKPAPAASIPAGDLFKDS
jgi:hypothetical protein